MHSAKESGDLKGIGSKRVSKVPPAMECAACVKLAAKVEVLENENKVLENRVEAFENDLNSLRENVKNLMDHVVPTNEIRLRVLLYQFRDYIGKHLSKKPANQRGKKCHQSLECLETTKGDKKGQQSQAC